MSFYDDYVADGLCCQSCGCFIGGLNGDEPGFPQFCRGCEPAREMVPRPKKRRRAVKSK